MRPRSQTTRSFRDSAKRVPPTCTYSMKHPWTVDCKEFGDPNKSLLQRGSWLMPAGFVPLGELAFTCPQLAWQLRGSCKVHADQLFDYQAPEPITEALVQRCTETPVLSIDAKDSPMTRLDRDWHLRTAGQGCTLTLFRLAAVHAAETKGAETADSGPARASTTDSVHASTPALGPVLGFYDYDAELPSSDRGSDTWLARVRRAPRSSAFHLRFELGLPCLVFNPADAPRLVSESSDDGRTLLKAMAQTHPCLNQMRWVPLAHCQVFRIIVAPLPDNSWCTAMVDWQRRNCVAQRPGGKMLSPSFASVVVDRSTPPPPWSPFLDPGLVQRLRAAPQPHRPSPEPEQPAETRGPPRQSMDDPETTRGLEAAAKQDARLWPGLAGVATAAARARGAVVRGSAVTAHTPSTAGPSTRAASTASTAAAALAAAGPLLSSSSSAAYGSETLPSSSSMSETWMWPRLPWQQIDDDKLDLGPCVDLPSGLTRRPAWPTDRPYKPPSTRSAKPSEISDQSLYTWMVDMHNEALHILDQTSSCYKHVLDKASCKNARSLDTNLQWLEMVSTRALTMRDLENQVGEYEECLQKNTETAPLLVAFGHVAAAVRDMGHTAQKRLWEESPAPTTAMRIGLPGTLDCKRAS